MSSVREYEQKDFVSVYLLLTSPAYAAGEVGNSCMVSIQALFQCFLKIQTNVDFRNLCVIL